MSDTKPTNPKEAFGDAKMPLGLLPDTAEVQFNLAFLEGALKYGQFNWRVAGVKASTYNRAIRRHLKKWWNGADADPVTMVHDLASIGACCAIILDAIACGKFEDDRPPRADMEKSLADAAKVAAHLKELFKGYSPIQYTQKWVDEQYRDHFLTAVSEATGISKGALQGQPGPVSRRGSHQVVKGGPGLPDVSGARIVPAGTLAKAINGAVKKRAKKKRKALDRGLSALLKTDNAG